MNRHASLCSASAISKFFPPAATKKLTYKPVSVVAGRKSSADTFADLNHRIDQLNRRLDEMATRNELQVIEKVLKSQIENLSTSAMNEATQRATSMKKLNDANKKEKTEIRQFLQDAEKKHNEEAEKVKQRAEEISAGLSELSAKLEKDIREAKVWLGNDLEQRLLDVEKDQAKALTDLQATLNIESNDKMKHFQEAMETLKAKCEILAKSNTEISQRITNDGNEQAKIVQGFREEMSKKLNEEESARKSEISVFNGKLSELESVEKIADKRLVTMENEQKNVRTTLEESESHLKDNVALLKGQYEKLQSEHIEISQAVKALQEEGTKLEKEGTEKQQLYEKEMLNVNGKIKEIAEGNRNVEEKIAALETKFKKGSTVQESIQTHFKEARNDAVQLKESITNSLSTISKEMESHKQTITEKLNNLQLASRKPPHIPLKVTGTNDSRINFSPDKPVRHYRRRYSSGDGEAQTTSTKGGVCGRMTNGLNNGGIYNCSIELSDCEDFGAIHNILSQSPKGEEFYEPSQAFCFDKKEQLTPPQEVSQELDQFFKGSAEQNTKNAAAITGKLCCLNSNQLENTSNTNNTPDRRLRSRGVADFAIIEPVVQLSPGKDSSIEGESVMESFRSAKNSES